VSAAASSASVVTAPFARAFAASASAISRRMRDVPWTSTLWQRHLVRKERLFNLVDAEHMLTCEQFPFGPEKAAAPVPRMPRPVESPPEVGGCQMPLSSSAACPDCALVFYNCPRHMTPCKAPVWIACGDCERLLCASHMFCYCELKSFASIHPASLSSAAVTVARTDVHPAALEPTTVPPARKLMTVPVSMLSSRPSASASSNGTARKLMVVPVLSASASSVGTAQTSKIAPGTEDAVDAMLMRGDAVLSASASFICTAQNSKIAPAAEVPTTSASACGTGRKLIVPAAVDAMLSRGDAVLSASASSSGTAQMSKIAPATVVPIASASCVATDRKLKSVPAVDAMREDAGLSASARSVSTAQMSKTAPAAEVLSASARCVGTARNTTTAPVAELDPAVDVPRPAVRRSSRLGRADVCKIPAIPAEPVLMSKCAANAKALSASKHVPPAARRAIPANLSKSAAALRASKRVPPAAQCVMPAMPVDAASMPKIAVNVEKVPLSASTRDAPAARCTTIDAPSTSSAKSKVKKVVSLCTSPNRSN
jgi:hypothetical protein